jgi:hypothetical protein
MFLTRPRAFSTTNHDRDENFLVATRIQRNRTRLVADQASVGGTARDARRDPSSELERKCAAHRCDKLAA